MLRLKGITKHYYTASETVEALKGVDISFRQREFVSVLGPSGCGKTTLLNIVGGLDKYTDGDLVINGRSTKSFRESDWDVYRNHRVGFIFQSYNLIPHQTILGNVELALTISGIGKEERVQRAKRALDRVGLAGQYYKKPNQLSGGQCQRVAIARALVNDPEILLADEPTGALDTQTSVQIMNLIREISEERLVIMVTHNPELAEQYSTRIIRLRDGLVVEDTNPFGEQEEIEECRQIEAQQAEAEAAELSLITDKREQKRRQKGRRERAKMSFFTAFKLSARNLISKRGRTAMVGFAGSIGIIGIALVLAFSAGIKGYIASMQDDMLSGNPIEIAEITYDLSTITGMMEEAGVASEIEIEKLADRVYVSSLVAYLATMNNMQNSIAMENTITREYIDYVTSMPDSYYKAMLLSYGIDLSMSIYTDFYYSADSEPKNVSVKNLIDMYTSVLKDSDFSDYAEYVSSLVPHFTQTLSDADYILSQYDLVGEGSEFADEVNEVMIVLNSEDEISDLLMAMLGYYTQEEFEEIVNKATSKDGTYNEDVYRDSFSYDELLGKTFTWYPNDTIFEQYSAFGMTNFKYLADSSAEGFDKDSGIELRVVGILTPKDTVSYGALTSGIYYTEALSDLVLESNADSQIVEFLLNDEASSYLAAYYYYFAYDYSYINWNGETVDTQGKVGPSVTIEDMMGSMVGGTSEVDAADMKERFIRSLGGNDLANNVLIYPNSFEEKGLVTDWLDAWNDKGSLTVGDVTYTEAERHDTSYTDTLEIVINMLNTMIDIVTYGLTAFTSVSLVVSTIMIGIITYVSVVERIKEIGVIRSLGGRKKDVSHLFNAETFIIGALAGLIGIGATYLISAIVNLILNALTGIPNLAALPPLQALLLLALSICLTLISGLIPAKSAANKDPVVALRTE